MRMYESMLNCPLPVDSSHGENKGYISKSLSWTSSELQSVAIFQVFGTSKRAGYTCGYGPSAVPPVRLAMSTDRAAGDISARPWAGPLGEICRCQCLICMLRVCLCLTSYVHGLFLYLLGSPFECITAPCSLCRLLHTSPQDWIVIIWEEVWTGLAASTALESCLYLTSTQGRIY